MLNEWFSSSKPEELRIALQTPIIREALQLLKEVGQPRAINLPSERVSYIEHNALCNARREGYYDALRNLEVLAITKNKPDQVDEVEPWSKMPSEETNV